MSTLIIGSSGNVGFATASAMANLSLPAKVGVRDIASDKAKTLAGLEHLTVVAADLSQPDTLAPALSGVSTVFIIAPPTENRAELVANGVDAAKLAAVQHIVVVSVPAVEADGDLVFKRQFSEIEAAVKASGIPFTILRLPMFMENQYAAQGSIKEASTVYGPVDPNKKLSLVAVADIAAAAAAVLSSPGRHANSTYTLASDIITHAAIVAEFTRALGREISYVQVPYDAALEAFEGMGFPRWQASGVLELMKLADSGSTAALPSPQDLEKLLGRAPTTFAEFLAPIAAHF